MIGKVTTGFQITIPLKFREKNEINIGDYVDFHEQNGKLIIEPLKLANKASKSEALKKFEKIFAKKPSDKNFKNKSEDSVIKLVKKEITTSRKTKKNENSSRL